MAITSSTQLTTNFGIFTVSYHSTSSGECVSFRMGDVTKGTPLVRLHSACLFSEVFGSLHCDCQSQLDQAMLAIEDNGSGVVVYTYDEGRGVGLEKKIEAMEVQRRESCDTVEAFKRLGLPKSDFRTYDTAISALSDLSLSRTIKLFSSNPAKAEALRQAGYEILEHLDISDAALGSLAQGERAVKQEKLGYRKSGE